MTLVTITFVRQDVLSINYKSKILKSFFQESKKFFKVNFVEESKPLGTAGSLSKIKKKDEPSQMIAENSKCSYCKIEKETIYIFFRMFNNKKYLDKLESKNKYRPS